MSTVEQPDLGSAAGRLRLPYAPAIGQIVNYYEDADPGSNPVTAVVVGPAVPGIDGRINLALIRDQSLQLGTRHAVPHVTDPYLKTHLQFARSRGGWDFTNDTKALRLIQKRITQICGRIDEMSGKGKKPPTNED